MKKYLNENHAWIYFGLCGLALIITFIIQHNKSVNEQQGTPVSKVPLRVFILPDGDTMKLWTATEYRDTMFVDKNGFLEVVKCYGDTVEFTRTEVKVK
jgi:hypothetical protein